MADTFPESRELLDSITRSACSPYDMDCLEDAFASAKKTSKSPKSSSSSSSSKHQMRIALTTMAVYASARQKTDRVRALLDQIIPKRLVDEHWALAAILRSALCSGEDSDGSLDAFGMPNLRYDLKKGAEFVRAQMTTSTPGDRIAASIVRGMRAGLSNRWEYEERGRKEDRHNLAPLTANVIGAARTEMADLDSGIPEVQDFINFFNQ
jgi:hypothetical protein